MRPPQLFAIAEGATSRDRRIAVRLLLKALAENVLRESLPELLVIASQELGMGVGREYELLARQFELLPSPKDRLVADLKRPS